MKKNIFPIPPTSQANRQLLASASASVSDSITAFRECYSRYRECQEYRGVATQSDLQETVESYILDFELTGKRLLGQNRADFELFKLWFVQENSAEACCSALRLDRFSLAQRVRTLETRLGSAFSNRGLYPVSQYFGTGVKPRSANIMAPERLAA